MKPITRLLVIAALAIAPVTLLPTPARAQSTSDVTITLRLTLNGTVPRPDNFFFTFPVNGGQFCEPGPLPVGQTTPPCVGGHTYVNTVQWPKGSTPVTFRFFRLTNLARGGVSTQLFSQQTVIPTAPRTVSAFFTYRSASAESVVTPTTGAGGQRWVGAGLVGSGLGLLGLCIRHRRRGASLASDAISGGQPTNQPTD